eukprot:11336421-Karenia_brevis.AAC.1
MYVHSVATHLTGPCGDGDITIEYLVLKQMAVNHGGCRKMRVKQVLLGLEAWAADVTNCLQDHPQVLGPEHHEP